MPYENSCCDHFYIIFFDRMGGKTDTVRVSHMYRSLYSFNGIAFHREKKKEMKNDMQSDSWMTS